MQGLRRVDLPESGPNPNSPCRPATPSSFKTRLDRSTNMGRDVAEVRQPSLVPRNALPVIFDAEIVASALATSRHGTEPFAVDAVFGQLSDRLHGIRLQKRDEVAFQSSPILSRPAARGAAPAIGVGAKIIARH